MIPAYDDIFRRTRLLCGDEMMAAMRHGVAVAVIGVGGVGSWCAEALVRTGIGRITLVDSDLVDVSNINRQLPATLTTVGRPKVDVLARRLADINPELQVTAVCGRYDADTAPDFDLDAFDYVIDAIDDLPSKALLILNACRSRARLYSSMGAARKLDPGRIAVAEFWKVTGCPLARALRNRFKKTGVRPSRKFKCVYSPETVAHLADGPAGDNGTFMHTTAIFGLTLASLVVQDIYERYEKNS